MSVIICVRNSSLRTQSWIDSAAPAMCGEFRAYEKQKDHRHFLTHSNRSHFVCVDFDSDPGADTFVVVTRDLSVTLFDRKKDDCAIAAGQLADWFSNTDEGQAAIEVFVAVLTEKKQEGSAVPAKGRSGLMSANAMTH